MKYFTFQFPGTMDSLGTVAAFIQQVFQTAAVPDLPDDFIENISLVASEAITNAIRYGAGGEEDLLTVTMEVTKRFVSLRVMDRGPGFEPNDVISPDLDYPAEGGYGIFIIKSLMDEVTYIRGDDVNFMVMVKRFG